MFSPSGVTDARLPAFEKWKSAQNGILEIGKVPSGPIIDQNWTKIDQNCGKATPKTSEIEEVCENEDAAVMNHPRYRRYDHDEAIHSGGIES